MKKTGVLFGLLLVISLFSFSVASAVGCDLSISMINQDPYPAIQGEEASVVFQIGGVSDTECGDVEFGLVEKYPISLRSDQKEIYTFESGTFKKDFKSFFLAPFKIKVSEDALDGDNPIEIKYRKNGESTWTTQDFNLNVKDTRANFEVYVKDYDLTTKIMTFEILNIAEADVEAITVEVPKQDNIEVKGANKNIVGDLDSNEYTTAEFEATPKDGEIKLRLHYSDSIHERRVVDVNVPYEGNYFVGKVEDMPKSQTGNYVVLVIVILLVIWWIVRRNKKKKELKAKLEARSKK